MSVADTGECRSEDEDQDEDEDEEEDEDEDEDEDEVGDSCGKFYQLLSQQSRLLPLLFIPKDFK